MNDVWSTRFVQLCDTVAGWSKDPSTKVGAVIVNDLNQVLSLGFNGFPRGVNDDPERYADRPTKYKMCVHAEANAILNSATSVRGGTLYVSPIPICPECSKLAIQAGIKRVVVNLSSDNPRWDDDFNKFSRIMLSEAGIEVEVLNDETRSS